MAAFTAEGLASFPAIAHGPHNDAPAETFTLLGMLNTTTYLIWGWYASGASPETFPSIDRTATVSTNTGHALINTQVTASW